jgi:hypothetical protein
MESESKAVQVANWIVEKGVSGFGPMTSAVALAQEYIDDQSYADNDERAWSLIKWETSKNASTGFATGLGGLVTLPVTVPAGFGASWLVQARLAAAVAHIHGHNLKSDRVRTLVLMSILGEAGLKQPIKAAGITVTQGLLKSGIKAVPASALRQVNQAIGLKLLTKAGEKSVISLTKLVPVLGGLVGGTIDGVSCWGVGSVAQKVFSRSPAKKPRAPRAAKPTADAKPVRRRKPAAPPALPDGSPPRDAAPKQPRARRKPAA